MIRLPSGGGTVPAVNNVICPARSFCCCSDRNKDDFILDSPSASPASGTWNHAVLVLRKHQPTSWCSSSSRGCARMEPYLLLTVHSFTPFSTGVAAKLWDIRRPALGCFSAGVLKETTGPQCCRVRPRFPPLIKESLSGQHGRCHAVVLLSSLRKNVQ